MMRNFRFINAKCMQGQKKRGVELTSKYLLHKMNFPFKKTNIESSFFNKMEIGCYCVYDYVRRSLKNQEFPIILGGDHTISSGSIQAVFDVYPNTHILWIDAHADINTPETSLTNNTHGMPVASLLGLMNPYVDAKTQIKPSQITYIGLRDVDKAEEEVLSKYDIKQYRMDDLENIDNVINEIKGDNKDKNFHISLDIDVLDPKVAPSTGTPVPDGMTLEQVSSIIENFSKDTISFDMVEINPLLGGDIDREKTIEAGAKILNLLSHKV